MRGLTFSLSLKLTICLIGSMVIIFTVLGYQNVQLHKHHLEDMTVVSADRISDTIKRSTRYSMMKNHRDEVYHIITTIGAEPGMNKIRIFNEEGKISFSTDEREVNMFVDKKAEACYVCHAQEQPLARLNRPDRVRIYTGSNGGRILGLINPIENEPSCYNAACHAHSPDKQVLGVLDVTMSLAKVDETIAQGQQRMVANFIAAIAIISLMVGGLIWIMVYNPVKQLIAGTKRVAAGDLEYKIAVLSHDEIGELAASFNRMTDKLKQANDQLTDWAKSLESRVERKTAELKRAHEQMIQVERMASIGKLAAIVAHEINNPLAGILTYAKLLLKKMRNSGLAPGDSENAKQSLEMIASESARCGEIVKNLLQFARQTTVNLQSNNVNEIIRQSVRLVQHKIDLMNLKTQIELDERTPTIVCDAQQIKQALVALLINACEAMTSGEGMLEVGSHYNSERHAVEIMIRDNGIGMDEETQKHIFEPFFTTKEQGKGVGLGLAVVYGIVNRHSGEIAVESAPGQGTTFTIRLPEKPGEEIPNPKSEIRNKFQ
jgi:two-component system NtrC family sensor kinase